MFESFPDIDAIAIRTVEEELSFGQLSHLADSYASHMHARALVFMKVVNDVASVAFYVGCIRNGIVPLMLNAGIAEDSWRALCDEYRPEFVWVPLDDMPEEVPVFSDRGYGLFRMEESSPALGAELGLLLSTSGSTGSPKLVRLSVANLESNARSIADYLDIRPDDRAITTLPFGYSYGISIINSHLLMGASVILNDRSLMGRDFWNLLKEKRATTFGGVPYTYQMLDKLRFTRMDLPSIRYITQAGGRLGKDLHRKFGEICKEKGIGFFVMYGQTEATARMSYLPADRCLDKVGSVGKAIPGGEFSLMAEDGNVICVPYVDGELVYRGPNVSLGYAECQADLAKGDERCGVLRTGDIARCDSEGFYFITGRKGRFLKVFGNRVGLDELEVLLSQQGIVAGAVGEDDNVVVFVETGNVTEAKKIIVEATGINPVAFEVRAIDRIPRSESGKIQYSLLEKRAVELDGVS